MAKGWHGPGRMNLLRSVRDLLLAPQMVGLGAEREALWNLEVVEMHRSVLKTTGGEGGW